jgi:hypothetical protein
MNDQNFWKTHTKEQVADYMKSAPDHADDTDPRSSLSRISILGLWLFGDDDNIVPVDLSVTRLESLIRRGHRNFEYSFLGYGHFVVNSRPGYASMVSWINRMVANVPSSPVTIIDGLTFAIGDESPLLAVARNGKNSAHNAHLSSIQPGRSCLPRM